MSATREATRELTPEELRKAAAEWREKARTYRANAEWADSAQARELDLAAARQAERNAEQCEQAAADLERQAAMARWGMADLAQLARDVVAAIRTARADSGLTWSRFVGSSLHARQTVAALEDAVDALPPDATVETLIWRSPENLPDAETTVLLLLKGGSDPVWPGYWDGNYWRDVDGVIVPEHIRVVGWSHFPVGRGTHG
jgi:hypothetical protein